MKNREDLERLAHIQMAIEKIIKYTDDVTFETFEENEMLQDAIFKNLEIIGEAAYKISSSTKIQFANVEWRKIEGLRHKLVHDYYMIDLEIIWNTRSDSLPNLKDEIEKILDQM